jgi:hypothetical protein
MVQYLQRGWRIVISDHQSFGAHQPRRLQNFTLGSVAIDDFFSGRDGIAHAARVEFERHEFDVFFAEKF